jgi:hypothetical protein
MLALGNATSCRVSFYSAPCMSGSKSLHSHDTPLPGGYLYFLELVDCQCFYIAHVSTSSTSIVLDSFVFFLLMVMVFTSTLLGDLRWKEH